MGTSKRNLVLVITVVLITAVVILALVFIPQIAQRWSAPLGPSLDLPTRTPTSADPSPTQVIETPSASGNSSDPVESATSLKTESTEAVPLSVEEPTPP